MVSVVTYQTTLIPINVVWYVTTDTCDICVSIWASKYVGINTVSQTAQEKGACYYILKQLMNLLYY